MSNPPKPGASEHVYEAVTHGFAVIDHVTDDAGFTRGAHALLFGKDPENRGIPGLSIIAHPGAPDAIATVTSLDFYFGIPSGIADCGFALAERSLPYWRYSGIVDGDPRLRINGQTPVPTSFNGKSYDFHRFEYIGPQVDYRVTQTDATTEAYPGSCVYAKTSELVPLGYVPPHPPTIVVGHVVSFTLDNGATFPDEHAIVQVTLPYLNGDETRELRQDAGLADEHED